MSAWREVTFAEALAWIAAHTIVKLQDATARFSDGSELEIRSEWSGPYSEVTPDIDADPPTFWIREHEA